MECKKCGKNIDENDVFCRFCGGKIEKNIIKPIIINGEPIFKDNKIQNESIFEVESYRPAFTKKVEEEKNVRINELQHDNNIQLVNYQKEINKTVKKNSNKKKRNISIGTIIICTIVLFVVAYSVLVLVDIFENDKEDDLTPINITKTLDNLKYVVPSDFEVDSENSNSIHKYIHGQLDGACQLKIVTATASYYDSVESYLEEYVQNKDYIDISEYGNKLINEINWRTVTLENVDNKTYYYVTSDDDNIYRVEFIVTNNEVGYCKNVHNGLLDSLRLK